MAWTPSENHSNLSSVTETFYNISAWQPFAFENADANSTIVATFCDGYMVGNATEAGNGSSGCAYVPGATPPPPYMGYNQERILTIIVYGILFVIAAIGNVTVLLILVRNRKRSRSRVNLLIMHLAVADCIVTFVMIPLEIVWAATIVWLAGDVMCRIMAFWRQFGLYLSSFVLIAISLDRYFAVCHPLSVRNAGTRAKLMLFFAWLLSIICSAPQSVIFHVQAHPYHHWFQQCVTYDFFKSKRHYLTYMFFTMLAMYGLPLIIITIFYLLILREIAKKSREVKGSINVRNGSAQLRRSGVGNIGKAKAKTLKMTLIIVIVFIMCWTPYYIMCLWFWLDEESAKQVDPRIQRGLFLFAVSNSCMDPIVYGLFTINVKRDLQRCCPCGKKRREDNYLSNSGYTVCVREGESGCARNPSMYNGRRLSARYAAVNSKDPPHRSPSSYDRIHASPSVHSGGGATTQMSSV
ncbi:PREDICTED: gonadotropin-releasing hormone II receptor-like [Priapulus caudatus]|uniref:Gonadotropin-releasing hormone II receptor-like n=1 Tax=Priapulus caudatus TaxID=37621 RepID=A0ABM1FAG9_PRICU|nr:PREDICTED: gonadotropin-releasing hormone II receptor-like [Priapulus caudatus]XP_014681441.1 PREDICTED: gonadotropin-releasing hormone II receptor-like [Priapulus caudatus]